MDRRRSLKTLAIGSLSAATLLAACGNEDTRKEAGKKQAGNTGGESYGRTPEEIAHDEKLQAIQFFTAAEMATITILCDIIIPADQHSGSASDAGVPAFIEFTVKDQPDFQTPLRGGLRWLDMRSLKLFDQPFADASPDQRVQLVEAIAWPEKVTPENRPGMNFFNVMRNLTATGFFTSKMGIEDLGYKGNRPNNWDGVPDDVLKEFGVEYDTDLLSKCLRNEDRGKIMIWEDDQ